jgi:hypothetical protein
MLVLGLLEEGFLGESEIVDLGLEVGIFLFEFIDLVV